MANYIGNLAVSRVSSAVHSISTSTWKANTQYQIGDIFVVDPNVGDYYVVTQNHTSGTSFDPSSPNYRRLARPYGDSGYDPTNFEDIGAGFEIGSMIVNDSLYAAWRCFDNTAGGAIWLIMSADPKLIENDSNGVIVLDRRWYDRRQVRRTVRNLTGVAVNGTNVVISLNTAVANKVIKVTGCLVRNDFNIYFHPASFANTSVSVFNHWRYETSTGNLYIDTNNAGLGPLTAGNLFIEFV